MKHLILLIVIMAGAATQAQQTRPCLKLSKVKIADKVLHQNGTAQVELTFEGQHCYVFNGAPDQARAWPEFELQPVSGLDTRVTGRGAARFDQTTVGAQIFRAQEISATLQVAVAPDLSLGKHSLPGQVRYNVMDGLGNVSEETLAFDVPLKVEGPSKHASSAGFNRPPDFFERHPVWSKVLIPFAIVAFIPLSLIEAIILGWDGC